MKYRINLIRGTEAHEIADQGIVDEVVIDDWFHLEQMDQDLYWLRIGDARIFVDITDQRQPVVKIERGAYASIRGKTTIDDAKIPDPDEEMG